MRILVTGSSGFVGSNICERLAGLNYSVTGCDNYLFGDRRNEIQSIPHLQMDYSAISRQILDDFDILIHCAVSNIIYAQTHELETFHNNALNAITLFQKFKGKIVYPSTSSVYHQASVIPTPETTQPETHNAYDSSKLVAELFLQARGNYTTLRLSNVYGYRQRLSPYSGVVSRMADAAMHGRPIPIIGDGKSTRDYTFIDDVVDAVIKTVELPALNTEINIGTAIETSVLSLSKTLCEILHRPHNICFIPKRNIDTIARRCLDSTKAGKLLGWTPKVLLKEGIARTVEWYKQESSTS